MASAWTAAEFQRLVPPPRDTNSERAQIRAAYVQALVDGWADLETAQINTPLRRCHFVAQWMHETGDFSILRENMSYSLDGLCKTFPTHFSKSDPVFMAKYAACRGNPEKIAELAYGCKTRPELGNSEEGDAWAYRGGGFNQLTSRPKYRDTGHAIGVDLEGHPELIEDPRVSLRAAIYEWTATGCNRFADRNYGRAIGNAINRGNPYSKHEPIGAAERKRCFDRAWAVLGSGELPSPLDLALGAYGPQVAEVQARLFDLGYAVGAIDGVFGGEMARAAAAFKLDHKRNTGQVLEPDEVIGPMTRAALANADRISRPEREQLSIKDLMAAGSTEVAAGKSMQATAYPLAAAGVFAAVDQQQVTPAVVQTLSNNVGWLPGFKSTMIPVLEAMGWGMRNMLPLLLILAGVMFWARGRHWIWARLQAARRGLNLSR